MLSRYYTCLFLSVTHMSHHSPFPCTRFTSLVVSLLHIHTLPLTHERAHKHTQTRTNTHLAIWILLLRHTPLHILYSSRYVYTPLSLAQMHIKILHLSHSHNSPHIRMCISHTHSQIMSMCLHVTQHKAPCTCLSLSSTHRATNNLLSLPQSLHISHTLAKGFPVNNSLSIHQQLWQYGEHET